MDEKDDLYYASIDETHDGLWLACGHDGMMMDLDSPTFVEEEDEEFEDGGDCIGDAINIPDADHLLDADLQEFMDLVNSRNLSPASFLLRRLSEGICPPRVRIRKVDEKDMKQILKIKLKGSRAFGGKQYQKAVDFYEEALFLFPSKMLITPVEDMKEMVNILSNMAECQLRLELYHDAGDTATSALLLDGNHEKSRIRRAKAELALFKIDVVTKVDKSPSYLVQAKADLQDVLDNPDRSDVGMKTAQKLFAEVNSLFERQLEMLQESTQTKTGNCG